MHSILLLFFVLTSFSLCICFFLEVSSNRRCCDLICNEWSLWMLESWQVRLIFFNWNCYIISTLLFSEKATDWYLRSHTNFSQFKKLKFELDFRVRNYFLFLLFLPLPLFPLLFFLFLAFSLLSSISLLSSSD